MVGTSTNLHSLLFEHTKTWSSLTSVENTSLCTLEKFYIFTSHSSDTTHSLHDVKHQTLRLKQRTHSAFHHESHISGLHMRSVVDKHSHLQLWIKFMEHLLGNLHSCKNAFLFYEQMLLAHLVGRNAAKRCVVSVTDILGKRQIKQFVNKFVFCLHILCLCFFVKHHKSTKN